MLDVTYNGVKIIDSLEVTPPIDVTYNGSTIATLNEGDTKTLDILGEDDKPKILSTPIAIGEKEIPDVDALGRKWVFEYNLEVEVGGGVTPTLISFTIDGAYDNPYQAEEGMTWDEWCSSAYNTNGYFILKKVDTPGGYEYHIRENSSAGRYIYYDKGGGLWSPSLASQVITSDGAYKMYGGGH